MGKRNRVRQVCSSAHCFQWQPCNWPHTFLMALQPCPHSHSQVLGRQNDPHCWKTCSAARRSHGCIWEGRGLERKEHPLNPVPVVLFNTHSGECLSSGTLKWSYGDELRLFRVDGSMEQTGRRAGGGSPGAKIWQRLGKLGPHRRAQCHMLPFPVLTKPEGEGRGMGRRPVG